MGRRLPFAAPLLVAVAVLSGCDPGPPPGPRVSPDRVRGTATVRGVVRFDGRTPLPKSIRNSPCCPGAPATLLSEDVIVNANGTLLNAVVYLEGGPMVDGTSLPQVVLDQRFCQYVPHVVGVVVNQTQQVHSDDPTYHNVRIAGDVHGTRNRKTERAGDSVTERFDRPAFLTSACDVHPWMRAHVVVLDNPLFSITGADGSFEIRDVPPGRYTLVAWHETYGRREQAIEVAASPVTTDFSYHPPQQ